MNSEQSKKISYTSPKWDEKTAALEANPRFRNLREHWECFDDPVERAEEVAGIFREVPDISLRFLAHLLPTTDKTLQRDLEIAALDFEGKKAIHAGLAIDLALKYFKQPQRTSESVPANHSNVRPGAANADPRKAHQDEAFLESFRVPNAWGL